MSIPAKLFTLWDLTFLEHQKKERKLQPMLQFVIVTGRILYRKAIDSHKGEKNSSKVLSDCFFDVASSTYDETREEKVLDELILYLRTVLYHKINFLIIKKDH